MYEYANQCTGRCPLRPSPLAQGKWCSVEIITVSLPDHVSGRERGLCAGVMCRSPGGLLPLPPLLPLHGACPVVPVRTRSRDPPVHCGVSEAGPVKNLALLPASEIWQEQQIGSSRPRPELACEAGVGRAAALPPRLNGVIPKQLGLGYTVGTEEANKCPPGRAPWVTSCCAKPGGAEPQHKRGPNAPAHREPLALGWGRVLPGGGHSAFSPFMGKGRGDSQERCRDQDQPPAPSSGLQARHWGCCAQSKLHRARGLDSHTQGCRQSPPAHGDPRVRHVFTQQCGGLMWPP